jgi:hypothetical protein
MIAGVFVFLVVAAVVGAKIAPYLKSHISLFRPTSVLPDESVDSLCLEVYLEFYQASVIRYFLGVFRSGVQWR